MRSIVFYLARSVTSIHYRRSYIVPTTCQCARRVQKPNRPPYTKIKFSFCPLTVDSPLPLPTPTPTPENLPKVWDKSNSTRLLSSFNLFISSLHLFSLSSYMLPSASRLPRAASKALLKSSSRLSEDPTSECPMLSTEIEPDLERRPSRSTRDIPWLTRDTRR